MKLGFGLYRAMLDADHFRFARQCGATEVVVHLVDYAQAGRAAEWWTPAKLAELRRGLAEHDLRLHAIENFDPADWYDVLLGGPRREAQLERLGEMVRIAGGAGVKVIGYNFSLGGVCSRDTGPFARGGAGSIGMRSIDTRPIPRGTIWNMVYDPAAAVGIEPTVNREELFRRHDCFLERLLPVAESAGVVLAAHPDDPPAETLRGQPRFIRSVADYGTLLRRHPSRAWGMELCLGTIAEMPGEDIYAATDALSRDGRIGYVHFRNVRGKVPSYVETFVDEGDVDMLRVVSILARNRYGGVLIPDHAPRMHCAAGWHAGMAFTMGFMKAAIARCTAPA